MPPNKKAISKKHKKIELKQADDLFLLGRLPPPGEPRLERVYVWDIRRLG